MIRPVMRRHDDRRPWGLLIVLSAAIVAGLLSLPLQVATYRSLDAATAEDVRQTQELTAQLARQEAETAAEAQAFREDNRRLTLAICDQIEAIAAQAELDVPPCPRVQTDPATLIPTPTPTADGSP